MALVLVIEDLSEICELFEIFFEKQNITVISTRKGEEGICLFQEQSPTAVIVDLKLLDMDGLTVVKKIRQLDKKVKIFVCSGSYSPELEEEAKAAGATGFLRKSDGIQEIVNKVKQEISAVI